MYKYIKPLKKKFHHSFKQRFESEEVGYYRKRLFGHHEFSWKNLKFFALRFTVWLAVFCLLLFIWYAKDLPTPWNIKKTQSATPAQIFDRNGKPIYSVYGGEKRFDLTPTQIPLTVKEATITAEDRNFYHHFGIDLKGVARAAYNDIFNRSGFVSGGSTITQQYVKNALLSPQKTFDRKIKEVILSLEVEMMYSKEQILAMYLNEISYGNNAYGIQAAAKTYFGKDAKDLTLAETAMLAALPQRPTYFSPYGTHPDERIARVNWILDGMVKQNYATQADVDKAKTEAKNLKFSPPNQYITAPHFVQYVKEQLVQAYGEKMVNEGGLKVTTTLDLEKQGIAEQTLKDSASRLGSINATNAALVSIDPKTGEILAMVGSIDYFNNSIDGQVNVADAQRQPGSSFKPIVYATAFKGKYNPATVLWDVPTDFGNYKPQNYDGNFRGPVSIRSALAQSLNIPAVKALYLAGVPQSLQTAHDMGITTLNQPDRYGLSLVLGGGEVKLTDLTAAYGVFANQGKIVPMTPILKVTTGSGNVLEDNTSRSDSVSAGKQVIDPQIAYEISSILSDNNARAPEFGSNSALYFSDRPVAAKTGTTSEYRDAWTIGYTPDVVTGVWVGNNNNSKMTAGAAGAMAAAPIWHSYMAKVFANTPVADFQMPDGITKVMVDKLSNKLPTQFSPETITDIFAKWQVPTTKDDIHTVVRIDKASGLLATADCPDAFTENRVITNLHSEVPTNPAWEGPVRAAAASMGINLSMPSNQTSCTYSTNEGGLIFASPTDGANVSPSFTVKIATKTKNVKKVDLAIDDKTVGSDSSGPFNFSVKNLALGQHTLSVIGTDDKGATSSTSIKITVVNKATTTAPITNTSAIGNVTNISVVAGTGSTTINWQSPSDINLKSINIYASQTQGDLGNLITVVNADPSSNLSTNLTGLVSNQSYWFTLRSVSSDGSENSDSTQYSVTAL